MLKTEENSTSQFTPLLLRPITSQPSPLTLHAAAEPTRKRRGEAAEAAFLARATALGFSVLIPWGDSNRYDSVVELNHGLLRVQVKSATLYAETRYRVKTTGANGKVYTSKEIDFFVGYVVPENIWYIIPIQSIPQQQSGPPLRPRPPARLIHLRTERCSTITDKAQRICNAGVDGKARVGRTLLSDAFDFDFGFALAFDVAPVEAICPNKPWKENTNTTACSLIIRKQGGLYSSHSARPIKSHSPQKLEMPSSNTACMTTANATTFTQQ
jgi:hypothetical protein